MGVLPWRFDFFSRYEKLVAINMDGDSESESWPIIAVNEIQVSNVSFDSDDESWPIIAVKNGDKGSESWPIIAVNRNTSEQYII